MLEASVVGFQDLKVLSSCHRSPLVHGSNEDGVRVVGALRTLVSMSCLESRDGLGRCMIEVRYGARS